MNITYTYVITAMEMAPTLDGLADVITVVKFNYIGLDSDSGLSATFAGSYPVDAPDPINYVPLADLTEADVVSWIVDEYPSWDHPNEVITKDINNQIVPKTEDAPMPWAPPAPEPIPPVEE